MVASLQALKPSLVLYGVALLVGLIGHYGAFHLILRLTRRATWITGHAFVRHCYRPLQWTLILLVTRVATKPTVSPPTPEPAAMPQVPEMAGHVFALILISLVAWLLIRIICFAEEYVLSHFDVSVKDNLKARKVHTQFKVFKRIATISVIVLSFGCALMTFERIRQLGTTLLASAGIVGILLGMAAQKTIATFIAGFQIAITQPIRVDDVVIVEGEWGRIEEITLTYVVVRIWDLRRLIVPITYFIEKPFQNWTRISADILGTVFLYMDPTIPVDAVRRELQAILEASEHWDHKVCTLQVTNTSERTIELRALMSAADASAAWALRCEVREKLIDFIQRQYPHALPRLRAELEPLSK